jgi:hypothetical protein
VDQQVGEAMIDFKQKLNGRNLMDVSRTEMATWAKTREGYAQLGRLLERISKLGKPHEKVRDRLTNEELEALLED